MELIRPKKQGSWGWPGVVNFVLGGMATGFYLLSSLVAILQNGTLGVPQSMGFKLLAPALTGLGFLALTTGSSHVKSMIMDVSHPLRNRHLFRHLRRSWMSRETLAATIFVLVAVLDWLFPHSALWALAAAAAMGLMISHGFIVYRVRAMTAWNVPPIPLLFLTSGFITGGGLVLLAALGKSPLGVGPVVVIGLICVVLDLAVWLLYLRWSHDTAFQGATKALRRPNSLIFTVGIGHLLPVLLLSLLVVPGVDARVGLVRLVAALAGLAMIAGGASQKAGIILKAGYPRGIVLGRMKGDSQGASLAHPSFAAHRSPKRTY